MDKSIMQISVYGSAPNSTSSGIINSPRNHSAVSQIIVVNQIYESKSCDFNENNFRIILIFLIVQHSFQ